MLYIFPVRPAEGMIERTFLLMLCYSVIKLMLIIIVIKATTALIIWQAS